MGVVCRSRKSAVSVVFKRKFVAHTLTVFLNLFLSFLCLHSPLHLLSLLKHLGFHHAIFKVSENIMALKIIILKSRLSAASLNHAKLLLIYL